MVKIKNFKKDQGDVDFDVEATNESSSKHSKMDGKNFKRDSKNTKYGFGGKKRNIKQNTRASTDDMSTFNTKKMKESGRNGKRPAGGVGKKTKRPGKASRQRK
jgi:rRNA-processing protein EBP2